MAKDLSLPDPAIILDLIEAFRRSKTMFAAVSLGVFDALNDGPKSLDVLAKHLNADDDALKRLLDGCVGLQLLVRTGEGDYGMTPAAKTYLTSTSPNRFTGYIGYSNSVLWKLWGNLEDAIREGTNRWKQTYGWDSPLFENFFHTPEALREFLMGMHGFGMLSSPVVVNSVDLSRFQTLVDLGGATGHLAIAACQRYVGLKAVLFDLPGALPLAREIIAASGMADRISLVGGDFFSDPLPEGDLIALGRILHDWTEEKIHRLLKRIYDRLPTNGAILIAEKLLLEDYSGPRVAQMQSLNMLTCTEGKERTLSEYEALLQQAGFSDVVGCRTSSVIDVVMATKR
ncbi:class I SAM-dependent methyltransferase [Schlesneria paludicola]|uniref:class I SAM-dependent methyltransferase n=1 Tax=Schlesneria paludicola TaxID=360056 RepID=UPI00029A45F3|nr:class I SAM-dependent methyltransferase [Schlesneria paludicola]